MFLTIEIRGSTKLVRHRQGEEVSEPVLEYEAGGGEEDPGPRVVGRVDQNQLLRDTFSDRQNRPSESRRELLPDSRMVLSTGGASAGHGFGDQDETPEQQHQQRHRRERQDRLGGPDEGKLLRLATERPRRFLRQLYAESARRGPLTIRFVRPLNVGRAVLEINVHKSDLTADARLEVARAMGGAMEARAQRVRGMSAFEVELEAVLQPDGDLRGVSAQWRTHGLALDEREDRIMDRLARTVARIAEGAAGGADRKSRLTRVMRTWLRDHPVWAVALLQRLLDDLEALPLSPSVRQARAERRRRQGGPTLQELLSDDEPEPSTGELLRTVVSPPALEWLDDRTPRVLLAGTAEDPTCDAELARLACVVPALLDLLG